MKLVCLSDLHGHLPENLPQADCVILAGDYMPDQHYQEEWVESCFAPWLQGLSQRAFVIGVAGNHDRLFEEQPQIAKNLTWNYLQNSSCSYGGLKFWGTPWTHQIFPMAFAASKEELQRAFEQAPTQVDVVVSHGPPHGVLDRDPSGQHVGSLAFRRWVLGAKPQVVVSGHIHGGYGQARLGSTTVINAALVDEDYVPRNPLILIEL